MQIEALTRDLVLTNDQLEKVASILLNEFNEGLGRLTNPDASVKMFPTFVRDVPNGKGKYGSCYLFPLFFALTHLVMSSFVHFISYLSRILMTFFDNVAKAHYD